MKRKFTLIEKIEFIIIISMVVVFCLTNTSNVMKSNTVKDNVINKDNSIKLLNDKKYIAKYINDEEVNVNDLYATLQNLEQRINGLSANEINERINSLTDKNNINNLFLKSYPVGSIYVSNQNTNPGTIFGGTWVSFGTGRTIVGVDTSQSEFNTIEKTGGEKTHTLSVSEIPSHDHTVFGITAGAVNSSPARLRLQNDGNLVLYGSNGSALWNSGTNASSQSKTYRQVSIGEDGTSGSSGSGGSHNNLQPYITVYMWKRTA